MCNTNFRRDVTSNKVNKESHEYVSKEESEGSVSSFDLKNQDSRKIKRVTFYCTKEKFLELVEEKSYKRRNTKLKKNCSRTYTIFKSGIWQKWITRSLRKECNINCGYLFRKASLNSEATSGTIFVSLNEELCLSCRNVDSARAILASREVEDWRGLINKKGKTKTVLNNEIIKPQKRIGGEKTRCKSSKRSKYIDNNLETFDALSHEALGKVPILKNANFEKLKSIKIKEREYSFLNSCPFDSIVQVLIVSAFDNPEILSLVQSLNDIPMFGLMSYILEKGIQTHVYRLRAQILIEITPKKQIRKLIHNMYLVNCAADASEVAGKLFRSIPSFREMTSCDEGCLSRKRKLETFCVQNSALENEKFIDVINRHGTLRDKLCPKNRNHGLMKSVVTETGPFMVIELTAPRRMNLSDIPLTFDDILWIQMNIISY